MPLSAFKFRPRLAEFEYRLTPSTVVGDFVYTLPPSDTPPATTANDDMGTSGGEDTTNDDMGVSRGDGTSTDPGFGVSGQPPVKVIGDPPTGKPAPGSGTVIGGPGNIQFPIGSLAIVTDNTVTGDSVNIRVVA